jgi:hypothetical protein
VTLGADRRPGRTRHAAATSRTTHAGPIVAALLAFVVFAGLCATPGTRGAGLATARAAGAPVASLSAGLARLQTVQGVFIPDGKADDPGHVIDRVFFAASANGDRSVDIRYRPDYRAQQELWLATLKADPHAATDDPSRLQADGALTRELVVVDGMTELQQSETWIVDPFTRKVIGLRYRYYQGLPSDFLVSAPRDLQYVWVLSNVLDQTLGDGSSRASVQTVVRGGRPLARAVVSNGAGKPVYEALIDRRYGVTEQVSSLQKSQDLGATWLAPFHLDHLVVDRPISPRVFAMQPDYRFAPDGYSRRKPTDAPAKYGVDLGETPVPLADLARFTSSWTLLPTWLPPGFRLAAADRSSDGLHLRVTYRRGFEDIMVGTSGRAESWITDGGIDDGLYYQAWQSNATTERIDGWTSIGRSVRPLRSGAMAGWPAGSGASFEPGRSFVGTVAFGVSGTMPVPTLLRVADSLHQARPGPHLPASRYDWLPWLALVAAATLCIVTFVRARRRDGPRPALVPNRTRLPLVGVAAVVVGASLSWHRLYGAGDRFSVTGWRDPLAVLIVAMALFAGAAALRVTPPARRSTAPTDNAIPPSAAAPTATPSRPRITPKFATVLLGLVTLTGALLAVVYLPLKARFETYPLATVPSRGLGSLLGHFVIPLPGPGLLLAIAGAALIFVGGLALRPTPRQASPDPEAPQPVV